VPFQADRCRSRDGSRSEIAPGVSAAADADRAGRLIQERHADAGNSSLFDPSAAANRTCDTADVLDIKRCRSWKQRAARSCDGKALINARAFALSSITANAQSFPSMGLPKRSPNCCPTVRAMASGDAPARNGTTRVLD